MKKPILFLTLILAFVHGIASAQCSGSPNGGLAVASASTVMTSSSFNLSLTGASSGSGITYQWQSSDCGATWTDISGATASTLSTSQTAPKLYRCVITCTNSSMSTPSGPVYVGRISSAYCNLSSVYGCGDGDGVGTFTMSGACGTSISLSSGCVSTNLDNTSTQIKFQAGASYSGTLASISYCSSERGRIWIDFNDNGSYEATELLYSNDGISCSPASATISIPSGANYGYHRMRVMVIYSDYTTTGCPSVYYGSCVDYTAVIIPATPTGLTSNSPVCTPDDLTLTVGGPSYSCGAVYKFSGPSGFLMGTSSNSISIPAVAGTYTASVSVNGASSCSSVSTSVSVITGPTVSSISTNSPLCSGSTLNMSAVGAANVSAYSWTGPVTVSGSTTASASVSGTTTSASGVYSLSVESAGGCSRTYTTSVTVNSAPGAISGSTNLCMGGGATLTNSVGGGTWMSSNTAVATIGSASGSVTSVSAGTSDITYTLSSGCYAVATVTINPNPSAIAGGTSPICPASTTTLSSSPSGGVWASSDPSLATVDASSGLVTGVAGGNPVISYTIGGACTVTRTLTVNTLLPISGPSSLCVGSTVSMTNGTPGGAWSSTNTAVATVGTSGSVSGVSDGSATISYYVSSIGCAATKVVGVTASPIVYAVSGGGNYCSGGTGVVITLTGSDLGASYQIYNGGTAIGSPVSGTGTPISFGTQTLAGTYIAIANPGAGAGCQVSMSGSATVSIDPLPTVYTVSGGGNYCAGGTGSPVGVTFGQSGVIYTLYRDGGAVTAAGGANASLTFGPQTVAGVYSVSAQNTSTGCSSNMAGAVTVGVNPVPDVYSVSGGGAYCSGGTGQPVGVSASTTTTTYRLYRAGSLVGTPVAGTGSAISFGNQTVAGVYTVMGTHANGCTAAMSGSATISVNPTPTVYTVSGGGNYCSGGTGSSVTLGGSQTGVNYQLYNGGATVGSAIVGSGSSISFGSYTAAGTYSVVATSSAGCVANMSGIANIGINASPTVFSVGGGGGYCAGGIGQQVTLSGSESGLNYQLYRSGTPVGSPIAGTNSSLNFGYQTEAGIYTVQAVNLTTGCTSTMAGSATISVNPLPVSYPVIGGGSYCAGGTGVAVGVGGSDIGVNYTIYNGATLVTTVSVAGTGIPVSFGVQTLSGSYTIFAINPSTGCTNYMSGSAAVNINPLPTAYAVTGGGSYCAGGAGVPVGLSSSMGGVNYNLYNGSSVVSVVAGTGGPISFGTMTATGTYTVGAVNATTSCAGNMAGNTTISINSLPTPYTITSSGTSYCAGGAGIAVGLVGSQSGVNYQLYNGGSPSGAPVPGTGSAISFGNKTAAGVYTIVATNSTTGCVRTMSGTASITIDALPVTYGVTGGGSYCAGGTGVEVSLSGSESGVAYQLYNGPAAVGAPVSGTGGGLSFGSMTAAGTYTVQATNILNSCVKSMSGAATVGVNSTPTAYAVTGGGTYCAGNGGVAVGLANSTSGITYQLYRGGATVGTPLTGTGSALNFGNQTTDGTYTVKAVNGATACENNMTGSASVATNPAPSVYAVTGGGSYCSGGEGVHVGLSGSQSGISYQLFNGAVAVGTPVAGTGLAIDFGLQTATGSYLVVGTNNVTGCMSNMTGGVSVSINSLPTVYNVTGGGSFCSGGTGVVVGLNGSQAGMNYQLYNGSVPLGSMVSGTGLAFDFGMQTAGGTYTIIAYNSATGCSSNMSGSALVIVNSLPVVHTVTGGGSYCNGGSGVSIGLTGSTGAVSYQLMNGTANAGAPVFGTGDPLDFGMYTTPGTYSVRATGVSTGCVSTMSGTAVVSINALPNTYTVSGGGTVCAGAAATVSLNGSQSGVNYQLYMAGAPVGSPVAGSGGPISLGSQTTAGVYTAVAENGTTGCVRNMNGAATVNVNAAPVAHTVTGGGNYCNGSLGVNVGLGSSTPGVSYRLYLGSTAVGMAINGTGGAINFGIQSATGTYTVQGTNLSTGCTAAMSGSATVGIDPLPAAYTVSGGGSYCAGGAGVPVALSGSNNGISYQLMADGSAAGVPVSGTGGPLNFGNQTTAGNYLITATNTVTGCTAYMTGSVNVVVNALPNVYPVTGGGGYCSGEDGVTVGLSGSNTGISYQLYNGGAAVGLAVPGTGGAISFGMQTGTGTYTVLATNPATGCNNVMVGSAGVTENSLPATFTVGGGGSLCAGEAGQSVTLSGSEAGISYQLYVGSTMVGSPLAGTGTNLNFGLQATSGTYMVVAENTATGCTRNMNGSATIVVNAVPVAQSVTGGGSYCSGGTGVAVGLGSSQSGITYELFLDGATTGTTVMGTGDAVSFGMQTTAGTYTAQAQNGATGCMNMMSGSATVGVQALPNAYAVLSAGSGYCAGGAGVQVMLSGSDAGTDYQLYNGTMTTGSPVPGTGASVDFGAQATPGMYSVVALNGATGCNRTMTGTVSIVVNPLPATYNVTGGGGYCSGTAGAAVSLAGSSAGVNYQLLRGGVAVGSILPGTGASLDFGPQTSGVYTIKAMNVATGCNTLMTGSANVMQNSLPVTYNVTGGGSFCSGTAGAVVGLSGSSAGVNYQLYNGTGAVGAAVAGTGGAVSFGAQGTAGMYTVKALNTTTGCMNNMNGSAEVSITTAPDAFNMTGGGNYCSGGSGVAVGLDGSVAGVNYQLYKGSTPVTGAILPGTGAALDFGSRTAGNYKVIATTVANGCTNLMTGTADVMMNTLPASYSVTGGGSYCTTPTATGVAVGLSGSSADVTYMLYKDGAATTTTVAGTGSAISFGMQTTGGIYTAVAQNAAGCSNDMSGSATVVANPAVAAGVSVSTGVGATVCLGVLTTFTASPVNGGTAPAYQWTVNGSPVGLGYSTYAYVPADGDVVAVELTSSSACASPATATANVTMHVSSHQMPNAVVTADPGETVCLGTNVSFTATAEYGGTSPNFIWKKNGVQVAAGNAYAYTPDNGDVITCELISNFVCRLADTVSTDVHMTVETPQTPVVSISSTPGLTIAQGQILTLSATATGAPNATYQWQVNGADIAGAVAATYTSSDYIDGDKVTCQVTSHGACIPMMGAKTVTVHVNTTGVAGVGNTMDAIGLFPNPNNGSFVLKGNVDVAGNKDLDAEVVNLLGQVVYHGKVAVRNGVVETRLQLSGSLANGMYLLNLHNDAETKVFHFVLQQ